MISIPRGSNLIVSRHFRQADGVTSLPVSSLASLKLELLQRGSVLRSFVLGTDAELRAGAQADQADFELTSTVTASLAAEPLSLRWTVKVADSGFTAEPGNAVSVITETPINIT